LPDQICGRKVPVIGLAETAAARCGAPWREVVIRWNGDVQACNMFNPYVYGNIHRASLPSIWVNEFATLFRAKLNSSSDRHPYCRNCAYIPSAYT
jgi:radical SAM protein with 4Fe4S-binding SPASM domain